MTLALLFCQVGQETISIFKVCFSSVAATAFLGCKPLCASLRHSCCLTHDPYLFLVGIFDFSKGTYLRLPQAEATPGLMKRWVGGRLFCIFGGEWETQSFEATAMTIA